MTGRWQRSLAGAIVSAGVVLASPGAASGAPRPDADARPASDFIGLVGADQYLGGAYLRFDYVFDDRGAATGPAIDDPENLVFPGATAARSSRGGYRYPTEDDNLADIVSVGVLPTQVHVQFNALLPESTVLAVAIDTDDDLGTGDGVWPLGAGLATPGADVVVTAFDGAPGVVYDTQADTITLPLPEAVRGGRTKIWIGAGLWSGDAWAAVPPGVTGNAAGAGSRPGLPLVFDLAFNTGEVLETAQDYWHERRQAEDLASGDVTAHHAVIDWDRLMRGDRSIPRPTPGTFSSIVHRSSIDLGDGLVAEPRRPHDNFVYRSAWQPVTVYVPKSLQDPAPLVWLMHARGMNQNGFAVIDHRFAQIGEDLGAVVATPLSRGEYRMCEADAEVDFFDAWRALDVALPLDPDRVYLTGLSMGGICMWRLGLLYPDLFAAGIAVAGSPRLGSYPNYRPLPVPYDMTDFVENARHLPIMILHGASDGVLPYTESEPAVGRLAELGYEHRVHLYATRGHDATLTSATAAEHVSWLAGRSRPTSPRHVTYRLWPSHTANVDPSFMNEDHGIRPDRAYWVSDLRQSDASVPSRIEALVGTTDTPVLVPVQDTGTSDAGPYLAVGGVPTVDRPAPMDEGGDAPQRLTLTAENLSSLSVDLERADLRTDRPIEVVVSGEVEVKLFGRWSVRPRVEGTSPTSGLGVDHVTLAGPGQFSISPVAHGATVAAPPLPSTGGGRSVVAGLLMLATCLAYRRKPCPSQRRGS